MRTSLKFSHKKTILIIIVNWAIAGVQVVPYSVLRYANQLQGSSENNVCPLFVSFYVSTKSWIFVVYNLTVYLLLPLPILCYNYTCVVQSLLTSIKRAREMTGDSSGVITAEKARLKLTYMMITLVVIYILTVLPGRIVDTLYTLGGLFRYGLYPKKVIGAIDMVRGMNSWMNVLIYSLISRQFRMAFKEILCRCCQKPSGANPRSGNEDGIKDTSARTKQTQA